MGRHSERESKYNFLQTLLSSDEILYSQIRFTIIYLQIFPRDLRFFHNNVPNPIASGSKSCAERFGTGIFAVGVSKYIQFHRVSLSASVTNVRGSVHAHRVLAQY